MILPVGFGFNYTWLALLLFSTVLGLLTQGYVKSTYRRWSQVPLGTGETGAQVARRILDSEGLGDVPVAAIGGNLTDNYDPRNKTLSLSADVHHGASVAAAGVAAHEAGHAIQDARGYVWGSVRSALVPAANLGSMASFWLIFIGIAIQFAGLVWFGIALYAGAVLFQVVTLPVELDASRRAMRALQATGQVSPEGLSGARQVLTAAALTYVAAALIAALQLLYFIGLARSSD
ncbi:MAG: zinc metallopeptidase [Coriobacteriales bacterium]|nr:zinc metallopeptidase [Coriobacteriales bacterium]